MNLSASETWIQLNVVLIVILFWLMLHAYWIIPRHSRSEYYRAHIRNSSLPSSENNGEDVDPLMRLPAIYHQWSEKREHIAFPSVPLEFFEPPREWYHRSLEYWSLQQLSLDAMMSGFSGMHKLDIETSDAFLNSLFSLIDPKRQRYAASDDNIDEDEDNKNAKKFSVLDVGGGVGRLFGPLLRHHFEVCDLLDPVDGFLQRAEERYPKYSEDGQDLDLDDVEDQEEGDGDGWDNAIVLMNNTNVKGVMGQYIVGSAQDFSFVDSETKYAAVWAQFSLSYLTDEDLVSFLSGALKAISWNSFGVVIVKDNVSPHAEYIVNERDGSVTRSEEVWRSLFQRAGGDVVLAQKQPVGVPAYHYPVHMFAIRPIKDQQLQTNTESDETE